MGFGRFVLTVKSIEIQLIRLEQVSVWIYNGWGLPGLTSWPLGTSQTGSAPPAMASVWGGLLVAFCSLQFQYRCTTSYPGVSYEIIRHDRTPYLHQSFSSKTSHLWQSLSSSTSNYRKYSLSNLILYWLWTKLWFHYSYFLKFKYLVAPQDVGKVFVLACITNIFNADAKLKVWIRVAPPGGSRVQ